MFQRSTKGASKQRRDWINSEINIIRDHLPVGENVQRRLSQLQVMALCNSYIAKTNCFHNSLSVQAGMETFDFDSKFDFTEALPGFLIVITTYGRVLYVSENVTEYLGHSMVDLMTQAESIYDIIDKTDQATLKEYFHSRMTRGSGAAGEGSQDELDFTCRMNLGNVIRRSNIFDKQKTMKMKGRMIWPEGYLNLAEPIFVARCTSVLSCSTHENATAVDTMMFHSSHSLDMKFLNIESNGQFHLGYSSQELRQQSWYQMIHPEDVFDAIQKHQQLTRSGFDTSKSVCVRVQTKYGHFIWLHIIMRISTPVGADSAQQEITCLNHVISEKEAYETKNRESWEEIMSLSNGNTMNLNQGQGQGQAYLPTVVVEEDFFNDSKVEVFTKPVECSRQDLMTKLRNIAEKGKGNSKTKRAKMNYSSLDSSSVSCSSSGSAQSVTFNHVTPQNFNCFSDNHMYQQQEASHYTSVTQPYQFSFGTGFNEAFTYNDNLLASPPTPPYSESPGRSVQEDCVTYMSDDTNLPSYSPANHLAQASNSFCTPPYSPQSDVEESQPVYGFDDRSFFDSNPPKSKPGSITGLKQGNNGGNHYLPEIPCEDVAKFFDSFECTKTGSELSYFDLIDSPYFTQTIELLSSAPYSS